MVGTAYVPELDRELYVGKLLKHTVLLNEEQHPIAKSCTPCATLYTLDEFHTDNSKIFHKTTMCKHCKAQRDIQFRQNNPDYYRRYLIENRETLMAQARQWVKANPERQHRNTVRTARKRREILKHCLPNDPQYMAEITSESACVITGNTVNTELDHVMPLMCGNWGNSKGNLLWLTKSLNTSKGTKNVFEWADSLEQETLDYLLGYHMELTVFKFRLMKALAVKAGELGLTLEQYQQKYYREYKQGWGDTVVSSSF